MDQIDSLILNNPAIGGTWDELERELFTPEEIAESDLRVALIGEFIKARDELSGVSQPVIARMEKGTTSPQLSTIMKLLFPLGKTLAIVPLHQPRKDAAGSFTGELNIVQGAAPSHTPPGE